MDAVVKQIKSMLNQIGEESRRRRVAEGQMTLSQLITELKSVPAQKDCRIIFNFSECVPTKIRSYRGDYSELAVGFEEDPFPNKRPKLANFIEELESCIGRTFIGYKGGEFVMTEDTPLWVANYSCCSRAGIIGIKTEPKESSTDEPAYNVILMSGYCQY